MTRSTSIFGLGSEFDNFLFAPIGEDGNDMPLSVLSALARLDIDPWQEAERSCRGKLRLRDWLRRLQHYLTGQRRI